MNRFWKIVWEVYDSQMVKGHPRGWAPRLLGKALGSKGVKSL